MAEKSKKKGVVQKGKAKRTTRKKGAGAPCKINAQTLKKLDNAFSFGFTDEEACLFAGISPPTLYAHQKKNPDYLSKKSALKNRPNMHAKRRIVTSILDDKCPKNQENAKWWLERRAKEEFSTRGELTGKDGQDVFVPVFGHKDVETDAPSKEDWHKTQDPQADEDMFDE